MTRTTTLWSLLLLSAALALGSCTKDATEQATGSRTGSESGLQTRILVGERRQGRTAGLLRRRGRSGHRIVGHAGYAFGRRRHPFGHRRFRRRARQHRGKGVTASVPGRRTERGAHARRRPAPLVRRGVRRRRRSRQGGPRHGPDRRSEQGGIQPAADARARRPGHPAGRNRRCAADPCGRRVQRSPPGQTMALHQHRATSRSIRRSRRAPTSTATRLGSSARATRALSSRSWTTACSGTIPTWPPTCGPTPPS